MDQIQQMKQIVDLWKFQTRLVRNHREVTQGILNNVRMLTEICSMLSDRIDVLEQTSGTFQDHQQTDNEDFRRSIGTIRSGLARVELKLANEDLPRGANDPDDD